MNKIGAMGQEALMTLWPSLQSVSIICFIPSHTLQNVLSSSLMHIAENLAPKKMSCSILQLQSSEGYSLSWCTKSEKITNNIDLYLAQTLSYR